MNTTVASLPRRRVPALRSAGLIWTLVRTDFKTRYHGTVQGFAWALMKPLAMFLVLMGVFSYVFASDPVYRLNLITGLFLWEFFSQGTGSGLLSLRMKGYLIAKARFPSWIVVLTSIANAAITLAVFSAIILVTLVVSGRTPTLLASALFFWYQLHMLVIVIGFSLASSVLFLKYTDLNQIWDVLLQAGFFVAPIIYPLNILPERFHKLLYLWPPTPVIQFSRDVLVAGTVPTLKAHLFLSFEAIVIFWVGALIFRRYAPRAAEWL
jgi:lipopolysaccharide transport system permease protein